MINTPAEHVWFGSNPVLLRFLTPAEFETLENPTVTSAHLFPMDGDDIMLTQNPRGIDIIGGHVEMGESVDEALRREAMEEGYIEIQDVEIIGYIQVDNSVNPKAASLPYPLFGYQAFYVCHNFIPHEFKAEHECSGRIFIPMADIAEHHHAWTATHATLLNHYQTLRYHDELSY